MFPSRTHFRLLVLSMSSTVSMMPPCTQCGNILWTTWSATPCPSSPNPDLCHLWTHRNLTIAILERDDCLCLWHCALESLFHRNPSHSQCRRRVDWFNVDSDFEQLRICLSRFLQYLIVGVNNTVCIFSLRLCLCLVTVSPSCANALGHQQLAKLFIRFWSRVVGHEKFLFLDILVIAE